MSGRYLQLEVKPLLHSLCIEPQRLILSPPGGDINVYGVFAHDESEPLCGRKWNEIIFKVIVKIVVIVVPGLIVLVRRSLRQDILGPMSPVPGLQTLGHVPVVGHLLRPALGQPSGIVLSLQLDLQLGCVAVAHWSEAVVQLGYVRAAFVFVVVLAELNADFAGRGGVNGGSRKVGGDERVVGVVGLTAAAAVPPPAQREFGDAVWRVVFQDQLGVIACDLSLLLPLLL